MDNERATELARRVGAELRKVIVGQDEVIRQMTVVLLGGGHALLEGVPGTAKTLMARVLSVVGGVEFRRIQFTPDMMPSDVIGVNIYDTSTGQFVFRPGPVFCDVLLADEINRAPAKTQSALLEAMQERHATLDGVRHGLSDVFTVFATQNPVEFEGTYPLPEAQVDRFMLKIIVGYPNEDAEARILDLTHGGFRADDLSGIALEAVLDAETLRDLRATVNGLHIEQDVRRYVTRIIRATRGVPQVSLGASPRAGVMLMQAAKAAALLAGRSFVTPDDVKGMARPVLRHRVLLHPEFEIEGRTADRCVEELLSGVEAPR